MTLISSILLGALVGWFASVTMVTNADLRAYRNIGVAIAGATVAGLVLRASRVDGLYLVDAVVVMVVAVALVLAVGAWGRDGRRAMSAGVRTEEDAAGSTIRPTPPRRLAAVARLGASGYWSALADNRRASRQPAIAAAADPVGRSRAKQQTRVINADR